MVASDEPALKAVCNVDDERIRLEALAEELAGAEDEGWTSFRSFSLHHFSLF